MDDGPRVARSWPVLLLLLLASLAVPTAAFSQSPRPVEGRQAANLTTSQALKARPAGPSDRRLSLKKRAQRLRRQVNRETAAPRSQARSIELKRLRPKLLSAENELRAYDSKRTAVTISTAGVNFVASFEGFVSRPEPDPVGFCTAGFGHLIRYSGCTSADIKRFTMTRTQGLNLLRSDLRQSVNTVNSLTSVKLNQGQEDALVSFVFNVGGGAYASSTLRAKLNSGDYCGAANEFLRWDRAGGSVLAGLARRRQAERQMFLRRGCNLAKARPNKATPDISRVKPRIASAPRSTPKSDNRCVYGRGSFSRGDRGRDVRVIQSALRRHHFGLKATSVYDVATKKTVATYQRRKRLKSDGVVGTSTRRRLGIGLCPPKLPSVRSLRTTVGLDGTPTFKGLALMLQDAKRAGWPGTLNSADRRRGVPERFGRLSQWKLWTCWVAGGGPGCPRNPNPANPPGRSTHELRSDALAYAGPPGRLLEWWQLGEDVSYPQTLVVKLNALGYNARRPYDTPTEAQHVNLYTNPTRRLQQRGLVAR